MSKRSRELGAMYLESAQNLFQLITKAEVEGYGHDDLDLLIDSAFNLLDRAYELINSDRSARETLIPQYAAHSSEKVIAEYNEALNKVIKEQEN